MKKAFAVMLDEASIISALEVLGPASGELNGHRFWLCTEADTTHPYYLRLVLSPRQSPNQEPRPQSQTPRTLYIPHSAVVCVWETTSPNEASFGFSKGGRS